MSVVDLRPEGPPLPPPEGPPYFVPEQPPAPATTRSGFASRLRTAPVWFGPSYAALLVATAVAYLWSLGASGWANAYYAAAVQAGSSSWKAFFFGSFDAGNAITVDKPPASLWVMDLSARIFGVSSWSILVPEALVGVATVALVVLIVKRWFQPGAALLAGLVVATTPVAALMFRFDNPDALLVLLLVGAAYAVTRAVEGGRSTRWLVLAGALVGFGFLTKMMQAFVVLPAFGLVYLLAGPPKLGKRVLQVVLMGVTTIVAAGWWVAIVELWPASSRPYIGGSQHNSVLELIFGYNGFGRLTGNETGSVGGGAGAGGAGGGMWGATGWLRMFNTEYGGQISWLLPLALFVLVAGLVWTLRRHRTDRTRAALVLWGLTLLTTAATFSLGEGIIHTYYTVALAPAVGVLVGIGASLAWQHRHSLVARLLSAAGVLLTAAWTWVLLGRSPNWQTWLRPTVAAAALVAAALIVLGGQRRRLALAGAGVAAAAILIAPTAATATTINTPHTGSLPTAGPATVGGGSGPGGRGGAGPRGGFGGRQFPGGGQFPGGNAATGNVAAGGFPAGTTTGNGTTTGHGTTGNGTATGTGPSTGPSTGNGAAAPNGTGRTGGGFGGVGGLGGGPGGGGLLNASAPGAALTAALKADASSYRWVAAAVGANSAAGYQLAADEPVLALGGFNGSDPSPTLAEFQQMVAHGEIHYFIGSGGGFGAQMGGAQDASSISSWVSGHYAATTIGGVTVYDLTHPTNG